MHFSRIFFVFPLLVGLLLSTNADAQSGGKYAYRFIDIPTSARMAAMGGEVISIRDSDVNMVNRNPSVLDASMHDQFSLSYINYFTGINMGNVQYARTSEKLGTWSAGLQYMSYGKFTRTNAAGERQGEFSAGDYNLNGSYAYGDKEATGNENAFNFDGFEINLGLDYRWNNQWVTGLVAGYSEREVEFEPVGIIVVDGGIEAEGYSLMPFALYQSEAMYASLSIGYQQMSFDSDRAIKYPSLNPDVASTNTRTLSSTDSDGWTASGSWGYNFRFGAFSVEPYLSAEYRETQIDDFTERDVNGDGFDLIVDDQDIESFEGALAARAQYTWTPSFGVFIPYVDVQWRHQFLDDARDIEAAYRGAAQTSATELIRFEVATDKLDSQYYVVSLGVSAVLRGARQSTADGPATGGIQAFIAYRTVQGLKHYTNDVVAAGLRYEF